MLSSTRKKKRNTTPLTISSSFTAGVRLGTA
jgi:hypothetical protein